MEETGQDLSYQFLRIEMAQFRDLAMEAHSTEVR